MRKIQLLLMLIAVSGISAAQKQKLGFNLMIGHTYYHITQSESSIKQTFNGQHLSIEAGVSGRLAFKVVALKDSVYNMQVTYEELSMTMKLPNGTISFSSEKKDEADVMSRILAAMKEKAFWVKMSRIGKIVEVSGIDSVFEKACDQFPGISLVQREQILAQLMQAYGNNAFRGSFEMATAIYSTAPVAKGSTWIVKTKLESSVKANITTTFTYKEKTGDYNLIEGKGIIQTTNKEVYTEVNGMPTRYVLKGTMQSSIKADIQSGWPIESKVSQTMEGSAIIKDNPKLPGGITIPMTIETTISSTSR